MDITILLSRIHAAVMACKLDAEANMLAQLAERVAFQGAPFEAPLTSGELDIVKRFMV